MATAILLPAPELQFCDADGKPYAGGSVATYVPGTTTPKATWVDPGEAALNTNPIILDAAGRCIIYGSGDYRIILRDAAGNLIYDQLSSTVVSDAMQPVVAAPTIADAQALLGITGFATSSDLASAISTEQTARIAADNAEVTARTAADTAETNARTAADNHLQSEIDALAGAAPPTPTNTIGGLAQLDATGHTRVAFTTPFASRCDSLVVTGMAPGLWSPSFNVTADASGFDAWGTVFGSTSPATNVSFFWLAIGH